MGLKNFLGKLIGGSAQTHPAAIMGQGLKQTLENREISKKQQEQVKLQKEFAQNGIQWKVRDAQAAGIHPLAALGAQTMSYTPSSIGGSDYADSGVQMAASMGQDISSALFRNSTAEQRQATALQQQSMMLDIEGKTIDNQIRAQQLKQMSSTPAFPSSNSDMPLLTGQGDSRPTAGGGGLVQEHPLYRVHSQPGQPAQEVGAVPDYGFTRTPTGLAIVPSKDVKEKIEDQMIPEFMWAFRNSIKPNFGGGPTPPDKKFYPLPPGYDEWKWNWTAQEFQPYRYGKAMNAGNDNYPQFKK